MADYKVENLTTGRARTIRGLATPFRPAGLLPVPYVSQLVQGALRFHNDCGPACTAMLLRAYFPNINTSVDSLFLSVSGKDDFLSVSQLITILTREGLDVLRLPDLPLAQVFDLLRAGRPIIALINYGVLTRAGVTERKDFTGPHFVVVVGLDSAHFYVHDPYYSLDNGEAVPYPYGLFHEAWRRADEQFANPAMLGIVPMRSLAPEEAQSYPTLYRVRLRGNVQLSEGPGSNHAKAVWKLAGSELDIRGESADQHWGLVHPWPGFWIDLKNKWVEKIP